MIYAKPATSLLVVFRAYLASDHVTPATGKTIAITISKNGGAFGNPNAGATNATEMSSGFYKVTLDTTDTGTSGPLAVRGAVATVDDVGVLYYVGQAPADVTHWIGTAAATPTVAGVPEVDITHAGGTAITAAAGIPEVKVASIAANAITATAIASDAITAAKIATGAIDADSIAADAITAAKIAAGAIDAATFDVDTGLIIRTGTCQAGSTGTTIVLDAGASATNSTYAGCWIVLTGGTGAGQCRLISAYTGGTVTATVLTWATTPDNTTEFAILPAYTVLGVQGNVTGNVNGSVGSVAAGGIAASSFAAGAIDATAIATGAIDADAIAADAVTEIQAGLATPTNITAGTITTATNVTTVNGLAANVITAASIATGAVDADALATDAVDEIVAGVLAGTITELSAIPAASPSLKQALALLYMALRNKVTVTSSAKTVYNDAGTSLGAKALTDDGTTYTEAEIA